MELGLVNAPALKRRPLPFSFTGNNYASRSTSHTSSTVPHGFEGNATATVTGNDATIRKNNIGSWGSSVFLSPGDLLNVAMTSSASFDTTLSCNVTIYGVTGQYSLRTCTNPNLSFTPVTNAQTSTLYTTTGFNYSNATLNMTISGGQISADNSTWGSSANIASQTTFWIRQTSSGTPNTETIATVAAGGVNFYWSVTTTGGSPPNLNFTSKANAEIGIIYYQNCVNQANVATLFTISCPGSPYAKLGNIQGSSIAYANSRTIPPGDTLYLALQANNNYESTVTANISSNTGYNYSVIYSTLDTIQSLNIPASSLTPDDGVYNVWNSAFNTSSHTRNFSISTIVGQSCLISNNNVDWANNCNVATGALFYMQGTIPFDHPMLWSQIFTIVVDNGILQRDWVVFVPYIEPPGGQGG